MRGHNYPAKIRTLIEIEKIGGGDCAFLAFSLLRVVICCYSDEKQYSFCSDFVVVAMTVWKLSPYNNMGRSVPNE